MPNWAHGSIIIKSKSTDLKKLFVDSNNYFQNLNKVLPGSQPHYVPGEWELKGWAKEIDNPSTEGKASVRQSISNIKFSDGNHIMSLEGVDCAWSAEPLQEYLEVIKITKVKDLEWNGEFDEPMMQFKEQLNHEGYKTFDTVNPLEKALKHAYSGDFEEWAETTEYYDLDVRWEYTSSSAKPLLQHLKNNKSFNLSKLTKSLENLDSLLGNDEAWEQQWYKEEIETTFLKDVKSLLNISNTR